MDQIAQVMLHYRDSEAITLFMCRGPERVRLAAKADVGSGVCSCTALCDFTDAPADYDPTTEILEGMLQLVSALRRERRRHEASEPAVQHG